MNPDNFDPESVHNHFALQFSTKDSPNIWSQQYNHIKQAIIIMVIVFMHVEVGVTSIEEKCVVAERRKTFL